MFVLSGHFGVTLLRVGVPYGLVVVASPFTTSASVACPRCGCGLVAWCLRLRRVWCSSWGGELPSVARKGRLRLSPPGVGAGLVGVLGQPLRPPLVPCRCAATVPVPVTVRAGYTPAPVPLRVRDAGVCGRLSLSRRRTGRGFRFTVSLHRAGAPLRCTGGTVAGNRAGCPFRGSAPEPRRGTLKAAQAKPTLPPAGKHPEPEANGCGAFRFGYRSGFPCRLPWASAQPPNGESGAGWVVVFVVWCARGVVCWGGVAVWVVAGWGWR